MTVIAFNLKQREGPFRKASNKMKLKVDEHTGELKIANEQLKKESLLTRYNNLQKGVKPIDIDDMAGMIMRVLGK